MVVEIIVVVIILIISLTAYAWIVYSLKNWKKFSFSAPNGEKSDVVPTWLPEPGSNQKPSPALLRFRRAYVSAKAPVATHLGAAGSEIKFNVTHVLNGMAEAYPVKDPPVSELHLATPLSIVHFNIPELKPYIKQNNLDEWLDAPTTLTGEYVTVKSKIHI